jgi:hypothetical protein
MPAKTEVSHASSVVSRLRQRLTAVVERLATIMNESPVHYFERDGGGVYFVCPQYHWGELAPAQRAAQLQIKREYETVHELINHLLKGAPEDLVHEYKEADGSLRVWIEFDSNWSLSPDKNKNDTKMRAAAAKTEKILAVLETVGTAELIVVPDTNSLLKQPDPVSYREIAGSDRLVFMLLPTVLGELDRLKIEHKNPDVRQKAQAAIRRIKGWRNQGTLTAGVTVDASITVRAAHKEPNMKKTLSWLDADVADDRIIAAMITLQAEQPSAQFVLVTADINLQNKADVALIETAEPPEDAAL